MTKETRRYLLNRARESISCALAGRRLPVRRGPEEMQNARCGVFVSLHTRKTDELRGCIGYIRPRRSLERDVVAIAEQAALADHRFEPVASMLELDGIRIEISLLSPMELSDESGIAVGTHGVCVEIGERSGLLLPQVAAGRNWDVHTFLLQACAKAGRKGVCWNQPGVTLYRFTAEVFDEDSMGMTY